MVNPRRSSALSSVLLCVSRRRRVQLSRRCQKVRCRRLPYLSPTSDNELTILHHNTTAISNAKNTIFNARGRYGPSSVCQSPTHFRSVQARASACMETSSIHASFGESPVEPGVFPLPWVAAMWVAFRDRCPIATSVPPFLVWFDPELEPETTGLPAFIWVSEPELPSVPVPMNGREYRCSLPPSVDGHVPVDAFESQPHNGLEHINSPSRI